MRAICSGLEKPNGRKKNRIIAEDERVQGPAAVMNTGGIKPGTE